MRNQGKITRVEEETVTATSATMCSWALELNKKLHHRQDPAYSCLRPAFVLEQDNAKISWHRRRKTLLHSRAPPTSVIVTPREQPKLSPASSPRKKNKRRSYPTGIAASAIAPPPPDTDCFASPQQSPKSRPAWGSGACSPTTNGCLSSPRMSGRRNSLLGASGAGKEWGLPSDLPLMPPKRQSSDRQLVMKPTTDGDADDD